MGRVINPEGAGKNRTQLVRSVVLALRELMRQTETTDETRDLAAFIALALEAVHESIETSVEAWEKRGYWLKADRYRMEWLWTDKISKAIKIALLNDDWGGVAMAAAQAAEKLRDVDVPKRGQPVAPWQGAMQQLIKKGPPKA